MKPVLRTSLPADRLPKVGSTRRPWLISPQSAIHGGLTLSSGRQLGGFSGEQHRSLDEQKRKSSNVLAKAKATSLQRGKLLSL
jgi:hypothetical protein